MTGPSADGQARVPLPPTDLARTLGALRNGAGDPCAQAAPGEWWWATRSPAGAVTLRCTPAPEGIDVAAWGPGTGWALSHAATLAGALDTPEDPLMPHPGLRVLQRRYARVRFVRTHRVLDAAVIAVLGQRVTGLEARRSWAALVRRLGEPAPGPGGLLLPPAPERLAGLPSWAFHPLGVDRRRAETIRRLASLSHAIDHVTSPPAELGRRLATVPGVGPWTVAETTALALGDPDALPVGDYHAKHVVVCAFTGRPRGTDAEMVALLAPFQGQRRRVLRWLLLAGAGPARVAPRQAISPMAHR